MRMMLKLSINKDTIMNRILWSLISSIFGLVGLIILYYPFLGSKDSEILINTIIGFLMFFLPIWFLITVLISEIFLNQKSSNIIKSFFSNKTITYFVSIILLVCFILPATSIYKKDLKFLLFDLMTYCCFYLSVIFLHYKTQMARICKRQG